MRLVSDLMIEKEWLQCAMVGVDADEIDSVKTEVMVSDWPVH